MEQSRRSGKPEAFLPPRRSQAALWLLDRFGALILRQVWQIEGVDVAPADLERLRSHREARALMIANHPSLAEPMVLYRAFRRAGVPYYVMTAWDTMARLGNVSARMFQSLGCYSVRRGRRDRASMELTQSLLVRGERVVLFPEGQTYGLNDTLLPFQEGAILIAFRALEELERAGDATPLLVVPMAIKYVYSRPMMGQIEASLGRLEAALGLSARGLSPYFRLRWIASSLVQRLEKEQGISAEEGLDLNARIDALREAMVERLAAALEAEVPRGGEFATLVQSLANAYEDYLERESAPSGDVRALFRVWQRLKNFVAVRDGYVAEHPSAERFLDVLHRLEIDVLGKSSIRGGRRAVVKVGAPFDLRDYLPAYREKKREALTRATEEMETRVRALLSQISTATPALPELAPGS
jgi:1-acyl-sn-glycerol-3-phosphate acyltransferase